MRAELTKVLGPGSKIFSLIGIFFYCIVHNLNCYDRLAGRGG